MSSAIDPGDLTARASIRNAALRLFAEHGADAVTVREIATQAGVSPALVVHHFGSKDGLRAEVDAFAARAFDAIFEAMPTDELPRSPVTSRSAVRQPIGWCNRVSCPVSGSAPRCEC